MTPDIGTSLGTMKYFPFGIARAGDVPTDIKFNGQRLDDTGLYYFNARYYDATIGRFISADTIIPDPMNPQAFNRYSYCLNNPLKYVDPSGHDVIIGGVDITDIDKAWNSGNYMSLLAIRKKIADDIDILIAYGKLRQKAPELTGYLESSKRPAVYIGKGGFGNLAEYKGDSSGGPIYLQPGVFDLFTNDEVATILSEELFHTAIRIGTGSEDKFAANEIFAKSFAYQIGDRLGCLSRVDILFGFSYFKDITPDIDSDALTDKILPEASKQLYDMSEGRYGEGFWFWRKPMRSWSNSDKNGDKFLIVAQVIWIK